MNEKIEVATGGACISLAALASIVQEVYFLFSFIAVACGAVLGIHGVYRLLRRQGKL